MRPLQYLFFSLIFLVSAPFAYSFVGMASRIDEPHVTPDCIQVSASSTHKYSFGFDSTGSKQPAVQVWNNCGAKFIVTGIEVSTNGKASVMPVGVIEATIIEDRGKAGKMPDIDEQLKESEAETKARVEAWNKAVHSYIFASTPCRQAASLLEKEYTDMRDMFAQAREKWLTGKAAPEERNWLGFWRFEDLPAVLPRPERDEIACARLEMPPRSTLKLGIAQGTYFKITGTVEAAGCASQTATIEGRIIDGRQQ